MFCPKHNKEMRQNSRGWYCPTKVGDGWCDYKPTGPGGGGGNEPIENTNHGGYVSAKSIPPTFVGKGQFTRSSFRGEDPKVGKQKALCGMVNGMLSAGAAPEDVKNSLVTLNAIFGRIQTLSGVPVSGPAQTPNPSPRVISDDLEAGNAAMSAAQAQEIDPAIVEGIDF